MKFNKYFYTVILFILAFLNLYAENTDLTQFGNINTPVEYIPGECSQIAAGFSHLLILRDDGSVWGAGDNLSGQLGTGSISVSEKLRRIISKNCVKIYAGGAFSLVLKNDGSLLAFGANEFNQLGAGDIKSLIKPVKIFSSGVKDAAAGDYHTLVLMNDGSVFAAGRNTYGQIGTGEKSVSVAFSKIFQSGVKKVCAGGEFSVVLKEDGTLWGTGNNFSQQIAENPDYASPIFKYVQIDSDVADCSTGSDHILYMKTDGTVWGVGRNIDGLIEDSDKKTIFPPQQINIPDVKKVSACYYESFFIQQDGTLLGCGRNIEGELGVPNTYYIKSPVYIASDVKDVKACEAGTFILTKNNAVYGLGEAIQPILGENYSWTPDTQDVAWHKQILKDNVKKLSAGYQVNLIIKNDDNLWAYGISRYGQIADTDRVIETPEQIESNVEKVSPGSYHLLVLKKDSSVWGRGRNNKGQLGNGNTTDQYSETQIFASDITDIAAGAEHSLFLKSDGTLLACGSNQYGQLGTGTASDVPVTTPVTVTDNVKAVAVGDYFSVILKNDGSVWTFGNNKFYQLGNNSNVDSPVPVEIIDADVQKIFVGPTTTFCIKTDGTVVAFGDNRYFQLGTEDYAAKTKKPDIYIKRPKTVLITDIKEIYPALQHTIFLKNDKTLWGCGINNYGQLCSKPDMSSPNIPVLLFDGSVNTAAARGDATLVSRFMYNVEFTANSGGTLNGKTSQVVYGGASAEPVTAVPDSNYKFSLWTGTYTEFSNPFFLENITSDMTFNAEFVSESNAVSLTLTVSGKGKIVPSAGRIFLAPGNSVSLTAEPSDGYSFVNWTVSGDAQIGDISNSVTNVTVNGDAVVTANFKNDSGTDSPFAINDFYSTNLYKELNVQAPGILGNDVNPGNSTLSAQLISSPQHGKLILNSDGSFQYFPYNDFSGTDSFTYAPDNSLSNKATVYITINPSEPPVSASDSFTINIDETLSVPSPGILINDSAPLGRQISAHLVKQPENGSLTLNSDGSLTYTPNQGYHGQDMFVYIAESDDGQNSKTTPVLIDVIEPNNCTVVQNGLIFWLDGMDIDGDGVQEGVNEDGIGTSNEVLTWVDKVNANNAKPIDSRFPPHIHESVFNGHPAVFFDPQFNPDTNKDCGDTIRFNLLDDIRTVFIAGLDKDGSGPVLGHHWEYYDFSRGGTRLYGIFAKDYVKYGDSYLNSEYIYAASENIYLNKLFFLDTVTLLDDNGKVNARADQIGIDRDNPGSIWNGYYAEVILYNVPLNDTERRSVEGYLRKKWTVLNALDDSFSVLQNSILYNPQSILTNDENSENYKLAVMKTSETSHGSLILYSDGSFYYTPDKDFTGQDSFSYVIYDGLRTSEEATVTINVISTAQHQLTVENGIGSGYYPEGATVFIQADNPERTMIFSAWTGDADVINDASLEYTFVTIPDHDITVTAEYTSIKTETPQYIISGYVTGPITENITIYLSGDIQTETVTDSDGYFQFSVTSGHYVVTPKFSDYAFTPEGKDVTVTDSGVYDINFSINLWAISGTVQGDKVDGVTITLDSGQSVVSGADGSFIFENIQDGTYTVTPSLDGYTFTPENTSVTVAGADVNGIDFTSTLIPETYTLTVNNGTGSGDYEENTVVEITAVIPSGKIFAAWTGDTSYIDNVNAATAHVTMPAVDVTVTATFKEPPANTFSISGTVTGDVTENITVTLNDGTVTQTEADGSYIFAGLSNGTYTVTPSLSGYTFTPANASATISGSDVTGINFTSVAVPNTYTLTVNNGTGSGDYTENSVVEITAVIPSGKVFDTWTGDTSYIDDVTAPAAHVTMPAANITVSATFKDPQADTYSISGTVTGDVSEGVYLTLNNGTVSHTAADGSYTFAGLSNGTYTVTPSLSGYTFTPANASLTISGADITGINFTSVAVSGTYKLTVNNGTGSGGYTENSVVEITAVIPSGKVFDIWTGDTSYIDNVNAATAHVTMPAADVTVTATFKDPQADTYSIAGSVSGDISEGVIIKLNNGTATATDADGNFLIAGLAVGDYILTPVLDGYIFSPENISVTVLDSDVSGIAFTALSVEKLTPVAYDDIYSAKTGITFKTTVENGVLVNDYSPDGRDLTAKIIQNVKHGLLSLNEDGSFSYTSNQGFTGSDSFTYTASNGDFTSDEAVVTINILPDTQNIPPSAIADHYIVYCNVTLNVNAENGVLANDIELDINDTLKALKTSDPSSGTLEFSEDGSFKFTPDKNFTGIVTFSYKAVDSAGKESSIVQVSLDIRKISLTTGMTLSVKADDVTGLKGEKFLKIPKIYGLVNGKNAALKKFKAKSTPDETFAVWGKKIRLYDKKAIAAAGYESYFETNGPLQPADVIINLKTKTASKEKIDETVKSAMIVPPVITQITLPDGSPIPTEGTAPGSTIVLKGEYFGDKIPKVAIEVNGKLLKCKVDKASLKFKNYKGKPSAMNSDTGESIINVILPVKKLNSGTYPLVLDNKIGIALTQGNNGKLPKITIK